MNEFEKDFGTKDEINGQNFENEETEQAAEDYTCYDEEFATAMSGTVSEKHAISIYKPKVKKVRKHRALIASVISSVVTTAICFAIFSAILLNGGFIESVTRTTDIPNGNTLSVGEDGEGVIKTVVNNENKDTLSVSQIYAKVSPAVVNIISTSGGIQTVTSSGSGVILTKDGYIVTNNHVIDGAEIITVKTLAGQSLDAQIVGKDQRTDLAVIKVTTDNELPCAEVGDSTKVSVGDLAVAIGNPLKEELASTLTVGYISAINRTMIIDERQMTMLQTDAAINPGNSGGALINTYGQVIGITTAKSTGYDVEGLGFAIPMNEAVPIIESIIKNGYVTGRPLIGITGIDVTEQIAKVNSLPIGVYVNSVITGSGADLGGIKKGDVIIECDGKEIISIDDINTIRDEHKVGDKLEFVVSRNSKKLKCTVVLQEEKPSEESKTQETSVEQYIPSDFFSFFGW